MENISPNPASDSIAGPTPRKGRLSLWQHQPRRRSHRRPDASLVEAFLFLAFGVHSTTSAALAMSLYAMTTLPRALAISLAKGSCTLSSRGCMPPQSNTA
ncbi:MAG: hypothetical protein AW06_001000 [Candidatus Accumulibacter cognatus]|uniref:Uncharacterized protein n=1 Tax=Candidatus Accumulibacter cognatus TaxID=2954383 RepID=A0A080M946_9PROT|nr:MAG: hypothetical protein AW06_001000 [Candidatus Accumulibacter cognatus]